MRNVLIAVIARPSNQIRGELKIAQNQLNYKRLRDQCKALYSFTFRLFLGSFVNFDVRVKSLEMNQVTIDRFSFA